MSRKPELDWEIREEDQDRPWPPAPQNATRQSKRQGVLPMHRAVLFGVTMVSLLLLGIGVTYARQEARKGVEAVDQDVRSAVGAEQWVQRNAPELSAGSLVDDEASSYVHWMLGKEQSLLAANIAGETEPALVVQDTWFRGDIAAASVAISGTGADGSAPTTYRQTRFYRETERGWLRTKPDPALWGAPHTLETDNLIWHYRRRDHTAVAEVARQVDALYVQLLQDYGLDKSAEDNKQAIDVQVEKVPGHISLPKSPDEPIVVPSPSVYLVPAEWTDAKVLEQSVALAIVNRMKYQLIAQRDFAQSWAFLTGIGLWQLWETDLALSKWRDDVVQWVYGDGLPFGEKHVIGLPVYYRELCTAHLALMTSPSSAGIPLLCEDLDRSPSRTYVVTDIRESTLVDLKEKDPGPLLQFARLGYPLKMFTVIDYAVTTYGRESLPLLVAALGQHDSWNTLVPAVYGVTSVEFERGWQQHIAGLAR